jgi:hypothetical protein
MLGEDPRQDVIGGLIAVGRLQFRQQAAHRLTDALQVDGQVFFLQPIDILPGVLLQIGGEKIGIALLVLFREHPPDPLQDGHQQLHPSHLADVGSQQGAIHSLLAGLEGEGPQLFIGDLLKSLLQQVLACLLHMAGQPLAEVVEGAQVKVPFAQVTVTQSIAHLDVIAELVVHLLVAPAVGGFQKLQADQHIHRHVGAGGLVRIEDGTGLFVQAAKKFPIEGLRPGVLQALPQGSGQFIHVAGQRNLQVTDILSEHALPS